MAEQQSAPPPSPAPGTCPARGFAAYKEPKHHYDKPATRRAAAEFVDILLNIVKIQVLSCFPTTAPSQSRKSRDHGLVFDVLGASAQLATLQPHSSKSNDLSTHGVSSASLLSVTDYSPAVGQYYFGTRAHVKQGVRLRGAVRCGRWPQMKGGKAVGVSPKQ
ncbi:hypothetical protein IF1G_04732 [Cordyceps javanica]|uniref:Uncharacterized protein n=1 Tax=Cordyceps javanica TaxID=43265 RepID=A0A545V356_9HYPO|nr:hypothetical protein IF1G_04732 [Cordyceps javanica]